MYNKRVLSTAVSELGKAKAPTKKRDIPVPLEKISRPFVSSDGYKQGPPPIGQHYRIPSDTLYNPTPYKIKAVSDNNITQYLEPGDTTSKVFPGANYVDEYPAMAMGGNRGTNRALFYKEGGEYYDDELTQEEIDDLIAQGYVVEDLPSAKIGGSLLTKKVTCKNCGWKWDAADGGDDITTCHKCGGQGLVHAQFGTFNNWKKKNVDQPIADAEPTPGVQQIPEVEASASDTKRKLHVKLIDKANALARTVEGRRVWGENGPGNWSADELKKYVDNVKEYNNQAQKYERDRRLVQEGKLSTDVFAQRFKDGNWARFDENTAKENYKGAYKNAVDEGNERKEKNMAVTDAVLELTGAPSLSRIASDPLGTLKGVGQTVADVASLPVGLSTGAYNYATDGNFDMGKNVIGQNYGEGLNETMDALTVLPFLGEAFNVGRNIVKPAIGTSDIVTQNIDDFLRLSQGEEIAGYNAAKMSKHDVTRLAPTEREIIANMPEEQFKNIVVKPNGQIVPGNTQSASEILTGKNAVKPMTAEAYTQNFNDNIHVLNEIINKNNKSGAAYSVSRLTPEGQLVFETPQQTINGVNIPQGQRTWQVDVKPGEWTGEVDDIANRAYLETIPGLNMKNSARSIFPDNTIRRGTGAYESINDYLKQLNMGRVKSGFNIQTDTSRGLWENAIAKNKAVGYYGNMNALKDPAVFGAMKKKGGEKKFSRSLEAKNRLFAENPLFKKKKSKKKKIFDPNAKYYQTGGSNVTQLSPEEEQEFQTFYNTLPDNLMQDDPEYDIRGYWDSEGRPGEFNYDQPTEEDGYYHGYSINSNTGEYLKAPTHSTFQHAVDEDRKMGYRPVTNVYGRNIATENESIIPEEQQSFLRNTEGPANYIEADLTPEEIEQYRAGGYIIDELPVAQKGGSQVYTYSDRPEAKYKKDASGNWLISLPSTKGSYVPIKDPTGKRAGELNEKAKPVEKPTLMTKAYSSVKDFNRLPEKDKKARASMYAYNESMRQKGYEFNPITGQYQSKNIPSAANNYNDGAIQSVDSFWTLPLLGTSAGVNAIKALPAIATDATALARTALNTNLLGSVPGATVGNLVNSAFIANSIYNTPKNAKDWYDVSQGKKDWKDAAVGTAEIGLGLLGSGPGWKSIGQDLSAAEAATKLRVGKVATVVGNKLEKTARVVNQGAYNFAKMTEDIMRLSPTGNKTANVLKAVRNTGLKTLKNTVRGSEYGLSKIRQGYEFPLLKTQGTRSAGTNWIDDAGNISKQWSPGARREYTGLEKWTTPNYLMKTYTTANGIAHFPEYMAKHERSLEKISENPENAKNYINLGWNMIRQIGDMTTLNKTMDAINTPMKAVQYGKEASQEEDPLKATWKGFKSLVSIGAMPRLSTTDIIRRKEGGDTDINKHRQLLRDWTYGADIGMLQEADGGEYWEDEIDDATRAQLLAQGYQIEDLD